MTTTEIEWNLNEKKNFAGAKLCSANGGVEKFKEHETNNGNFLLKK